MRSAECALSEGGADDCNIVGMVDAVAIFMLIDLEMR